MLRAGSNATGGETRSLERLGHVRDVHRIGAVYLAGLALGSAAAHVVVDGDTGQLRRGRRDGAVPVPGRGLTAPLRYSAEQRTGLLEPGARHRVVSFGIFPARIL